MKSDIDALMQAYAIDALLVTGPGNHNPPMVYLSGGANLTHADLIKLRGQPPLLFHHDMERDEAARTGLATRNLADYNPLGLIQKMNGNLLEAAAERYRLIFTDLGITASRVAIYGRTDAGATLALASALRQAMPGLTLLGEYGPSLLMQAMTTKDEAEVERIRAMGKITTQVVGHVADYLTSHPSSGGCLVKPDGEPLTIADVKQRIRLWLAELGVENPEGTIFASGYDAALPHSTGNPSSPLRLGETIIFDIFPCEAGGGYFYDFTRTWCLGYATDEALALYEDVRAVYTQIVSELQPGTPRKNTMLRACQLFEERGHPTQRTDPQTQRGFVHGLGHSLGLYIHEPAQFNLYAPETETLLPGMVMTVEPGLYYPERNMGVRLEDTLWLRPDGKIEVLAEYPMDLVLPIRI